MPITAQQQTTNQQIYDQAKSLGIQAPANLNTGVNTGVTYNAPPTSISSASLAPTPSPTVPPPTQSPPPDASSALQQIIDQSSQQTPEEKNLSTQNDTILGQIKTYTDQLGTQSAEQGKLETQAGIPDMQKNLNDINAQIKAINASAFQQTQNAEDRQAPTFSIYGQQAQISRQASAQTYGLAAASAAMQNNIALAQTNVQKALDAEFSGVQSQIDYQKLLLQQNADKMTTAQKKQADATQLKLQAYQQQLDQQKTDKANALALMTEAAKNGAPTALLNQALSLSPQEAIGALQKYLSDPVAKQQALLNLKATAAGIANTQASTQKTLADIASNYGQGAAQQIQPYLETSASGIPYVDVSSLSAADKNKIAQIANQQGIKVLTNTNTALDITNIKNAYSNLDTIANVYSSISSPNALSRALYGAGLNSFASLAQTSPQKAAAGALNDSALDLLKAISGVQGFRGNQGAIDQIKNSLPNIYDTQAVVQQKLLNVRALIQNRENAILGSSGTSSSQTIPKGTDGAPYGHPGYVSDGTQWVAK